MKRYFKIYTILISQYLKSLMEYKADFFVGLFSFLFTQAAGIAFIYLIFQKIPEINGWSFEKILFIYGFAQIPRGIDHFFTDNLWLLSGRIIARGEFDKYLTKPINTLFYIVSERIQPDAFGELILGIAIVGSIRNKLNIEISIGNILAMILLIFCGAIIYFSIKLVFASIAFWIKYSQQLLYMVYQISDFAKYPITIYSKWIRIIITFMIPFAFIAFYPAGYFIGAIDGTTVFIGAFLAAAISFFVAIVIWNLGLRVYESSGS